MEGLTVADVPVPPDLLTNETTGITFHVSVFRSTAPQRLSKGMKLDADGALVKENGGNMAQGQLQTVTLTNMDEFAELLGELTPADAIGHGICEHERARVVWRGGIDNLAPSKLPTVTRTRENFAYPPGSAVMMLDYDPQKGGDALTPTELLTALYDVWPGLGEAPHILAHSASSWIYNGAQQLVGQRGLRIYALVKNGSDIERSGKALFQRLLLSGHGWAEVDRAGRIHSKTLVDSSVWQPERLDFMGGAECSDPLTQRRPVPSVFNAVGEPIDTAKTLKDPTKSDLKKLSDIHKALRASVEDEAKEVREAWIIAQTTRIMLKEGKAPHEDPDRAQAVRENLIRAVDKRVLFADFELVTSEGKTVTVAELLDDRDKWHGKRFRDPLEPDYANDPRIAVAWLRSAGQPFIFSHAHGNSRYKLTRARKVVRVEPGNRVEIVDRCLETMQVSGDLYARGGEIVRVADTGEILPLGPTEVLYELDRGVRFEKWNARSAAWLACDAPKNIGDGIMARRKDSGLPVLDAVLTAPCLDLRTGRIVEADGYDPKSHLLLVMGETDGWKSVPDQPALDAVKESIDVIWRPFAAFPFAESVDRAVMLAAIFTTVLRPVLATAPAFAFTAPTAGSGKTLIARSLSALAGLATPTVLPGTDGDDTELRKRLLGIGRQGDAVAVLDNLVGVFTSDCLCAWLTAEAYSDRPLGVTGNITVPTRALIILTGNNLVMKGDLCRRVLSCRIDPQMETPWRRSFGLDPVQYCKVNRLKVVHAAITIARYYLGKSNPLTDRTASFEGWSDSVRRIVAGIGLDELMDVCDPTTAIDKSYNEDPETAKLASFLEVHHDTFGNRGVTSRDIVKDATDISTGGDPVNEALHDIVNEIAGERNVINPRRLGRWIEKNQGRIVGGLKIGKEGERQRYALWAVRKVGTGEFREFRESVSSLREKMADDIPREGLENDSPNSPNSHLASVPRRAIL